MFDGDVGVGEDLVCRLGAEWEVDQAHGQTTIRPTDRMERIVTIQPLILSGGSGTRLWPLSRIGSPKHLIPLLGQPSLFQRSVERAAAIKGSQPPMIACNVAHVDEIHRQLAELGVQGATIIVEPIGSNTAPAAAIAAQLVDPDTLLLILPADHLIADTEAFAAAVSRLAVPAAAGSLGTFGVPPTRPETGYGYIEVSGNRDPQPVTRFVEKPDAKTAAEYLSSGTFLWNSGMFLFGAGSYLDALSAQQPEMAAACRAALDASHVSDSLVELDLDSFGAVPGTSIDYAVMEHAADTVMTRLEAGWSDLGSWQSLWESADKNEQGNVIVGDAYVSDSSGNMVLGSARTVGVVGVENLVIIETADAVLVCHRDRAEEVKGLVELLAAQERSELL